MPDPEGLAGARELDSRVRTKFVRFLVDNQILDLFLRFATRILVLYKVTWPTSWRRP